MRGAIALVLGSALIASWLHAYAADGKTHHRLQDTDRGEVGISFEHSAASNDEENARLFVYHRSDVFSFFKDDFRSCNRTVEFHVPRKKCDNRLAFDVEGGGLAEFYDSRPSVLFGGVNIYFPFNVDNNFGMYDPYSADVQAFKLSMFAKRLSGEDFDERWEVDATVSLRFDCRMENFELPGACGWGGIGRGGAFPMASAYLEKSD